MDATHIERVYSAYSRVYDRIFGKVFQDSREVLAAGLDALPGQRVLEVGVGTGLLLPLYPADCRITGIDFSEGMLTKARERVERLDLPNVTLEHMDAAHMSFHDDSFDIVVAAYVVTAVPDHRAVNYVIESPNDSVERVNDLVSEIREDLQFSHPLVFQRTPSL